MPDGFTIAHFHAPKLGTSYTERTADAHLLIHIFPNLERSDDRNVVMVMKVLDAIEKMIRNQQIKIVMHGDVLPAPDSPLAGYTVGGRTFPNAISATTSENKEIYVYIIEANQAMKPCGEYGTGCNCTVKYRDIPVGSEGYVFSVVFFYVSFFLCSFFWDVFYIRVLLYSLVCLLYSLVSLPMAFSIVFRSFFNVLC